MEYILGFCAANPLSSQSPNSIDDMVISDNGDTEKVLATVVLAIYNFTNKFPNVWVYASGSTKARTRLYQMGINKYADIAEIDFEIMGEDENGFETFKRGKNYEGFAVRKKT